MCSKRKYQRVCNSTLAIIRKPFWGIIYMKYVFVILAKCPIDNGDKKKESISEEDLHLFRVKNGILIFVLH